MFIDKVFDMWNTAEYKMASNNPPCATREEYMKKLLMYKGKPFNMNKLKTKLQAESASYDEDRLVMFTLLRTLFDAFEKYFESNDFPERIDNLDTFIQGTLANYKEAQANKVVKVMNANKLLELYPTKTLRDEIISYSPSELFSMFGVFSSVYTPKKSYVLDREKIDGILCLEDNDHLDLVAKMAQSSVTDRYLLHISTLADNNVLRFHVPYILSSHWQKTDKGIELSIKYDNKNIVIAESKLKKVETEYDTYYTAKIKIKDYAHELHLLC